MYKILSICFVIQFCVWTASGQTQEVSLKSLVDEAVSLESVTQFPKDYKSCLVSSHDRRSVSPDKEGWFANDDFSGYEYIDTTSGRREKVLFDEAGPGVVTRMWITALNKEGTLRFYFDDEQQPRLSIEAYDFLRAGLNLAPALLFAHTSYIETLNSAGGSTLYLPVPFSRRLKITLEESIPDNKNYYQIEYRKYNEDISVRSLDFPLSQEDRTCLKKIQESLSYTHAPISEKIIRRELTLGNGKSVSVSLPKGTNAVDYLVVKVEDASSDELENIAVKMVFDGKTTVACRLSEFAGAGMGVPKSSCRYVSHDGCGRIESRWVMPYQKRATISLSNLNARSVGIAVEAGTSRYEWVDNSMYFHVTTLSRKDVEICGNSINPKNSQCHDERIFAAHGRGVIVGTGLSLFNHTRSWYGEGDEKIWVDDDAVPSLFGTGVEDYFNTSWAPVVPFYTPYGGAVRADFSNSRGFNSWLRTRVLDVIPFRSRLAFDMEMLGWFDGHVDYDATTFWYGDYDTEILIESNDPVFRVLPPSPPSPEDFKISGAVEFEGRSAPSSSGNVKCAEQDMSSFSAGDWSGGKQMTCFGGSIGDYVEYVFSGYDDRQKYELCFYGCKAADYGIVKVSVNGMDARILDFYDTIVTNTGPIELGKYSPADSLFRIRFTLAGSNPAAVGGKNIWGLDCMTILPVASESDDILIEDFESDTYASWTLEGDAFTEKRHSLQQVKAWGDTGYEGQGYMSSFSLADKGTGRMISSEMIIERDYINFLIGGGNYYKYTYVALVVDGKEVRRSTALNNREMYWVNWNVAEYKGRKARIEIVDQYTSYYGFILVDHIYQSDSMKKEKRAEKSFDGGSRYLHLPIKTGAKKERVYIENDLGIVYEFEVELDGSNPDFYSTFTLKEIEGDFIVSAPETVSCLTGLAASYVSDDRWTADSDMEKRPVYHFTAPVGWLNDPNGLYWYDGEWHMFYQHNPFGCAWGNICWGHAHSEDLVQWVHDDDMLLPDEKGLIFSGGAYVDKDNNSSFQTGEYPPVLLFYTCAGNYTLMSQGRSHSQCMAISTDGGKTFEKFDGNPVFSENFTQDNRDPDVFWDAENRQWVMALFLFDREFCILTSKDLAHWEASDRFVIDNCEECPDMYRMPVENSPGEYKWIIMGANSVYVIGNWDGNRFERCTAPMKLDYGNAYYAVQSFANVPDGRTVAMAWLRGSDFRGCNFNQQMAVPREIKLYRQTDGSYRLKSYPVDELNTCFKRTQNFVREEIPDSCICVGNAFKVEMELLPSVNSGETGLYVDDYQIMVNYDDRTLRYGRGGTECIPFTEVSCDKVKLDVWVDRGSVEVFINDGEISLSDFFVFDKDQIHIQMHAKTKINNVVIDEYCR